VNIKMSDDVKLSANAQKVMEMVEQMNVLELSELVKAMEEKFGVSASAPMMMADMMTAAAGEAAPAAEEKSNWDVVLVDGGAQKIAVIKAVRELNQALTLVDAKNLVDKGNEIILAGAKKEDAEAAKKKLEEAGGKVELK
jgi:large subunit ribosomal protein L7/L12